MAFTFNPFTGNFDVTGSASGGQQGTGFGSPFFEGEVATYADLPLDGTAPLNSRWLVRSNSGTWPFSSYKQAGVYIRTATGGTDRGADYTLTDTSFHDVMSDSAFVLFDDGDATKNLKFQLSGITTGTTRTLTAPNASGTIALTSDITSGVTAVNSTLSDILSVSGSDLVADDLGADKLYGWDDSASKAIGFATVGPTFDGTNLRWPVELIIACSDESSNLTTGTAKVTFRAPYAFLLTGVRASVNTAPTGSTLIVDINNGANSALSTKLSIDASEKTSTTAATAAVIDTTYDDFSDDAEITIDIDQIGSTVAGKGLKVTLIGTRA